MLHDFVSPYSATVVKRLEEQGTLNMAGHGAHFFPGAVLIGKTNLDEFGMGGYNMNGASGHVVNPWTSKEVVPRDALILICLKGVAHVSGGSSGGSAVAVAGGLCTASIGSDTGGSVRLPAAYCGVVGLKPSYGRCSRHGLVAYARFTLFCPTYSDAPQFPGYAWCPCQICQRCSLCSRLF